MEELEKIQREMDGLIKRITVDLSHGSAGVERQYANAGERYRTTNNSIEGRPHMAKLKRKYRPT